jgi:hypothetical protein
MHWNTVSVEECLCKWVHVFFSRPMEIGVSSDDAEECNIQGIMEVF